MARPVPEINAGSMADIAFLLLIFFLVATTMNQDFGLQRKLPKYVEKDEKNKTPIIKERNIFQILVNRDNELLVEGEKLNMEQLQSKIIEFVINPKNDISLSEQKKLKEIISEAYQNKKTSDSLKFKTISQILNPEVTISQGIISLQSDRSTLYSTYLSIQNEILAAFGKLKDDCAMQYFGMIYGNLDIEKKEIIDAIMPMNISEAEPRNVQKIIQPQNLKAK